MAWLLVGAIFLALALWSAFIAAVIDGYANQRKEHRA